MLKALNAKLGQPCFSLGSIAGEEVNVIFAKSCSEASVLSRFETNPPAGLYGAPPPRQKALIKNPETLRPADDVGPDDAAMARPHSGRSADPSGDPRQDRGHHADIVQEVESAVAANDVVVVGMRQNPMPRRARKALDARGIAYKYLEYGSYLNTWRRRNALKMWTGWPTFPMIFVKGVLIGGATDLERLIDSGELARLLRQVITPVAGDDDRDPRRPRSNGRPSARKAPAGRTSTRCRPRCICASTSLRLRCRTPSRRGSSPIAISGSPPKAS